MVDLRKCHKTQRTINPQKVQRLLQVLRDRGSFDGRLCLCLCPDGEMEILNGHHRATAHILYGTYRVSREACMFLGEPVSSRFRYRYGKIGDISC